MPDAWNFVAGISLDRTTAIAALGWSSGLVVTLSGLPNIIRNIREPGSAKPSLMRDLLQCAGNIGWATYGLLVGSMPLAVMCATNMGFMMALVVQQVRKGRPDKPTLLNNLNQGAQHD